MLKLQEDMIMGKLSAAARRDKIVELLESNGTMKMVDLADYFQVSRETIRRDLIVLNENGTVKKWFGGVMATQDFQIGTVKNRLVEHQDAKSRIAEKASEFIHEKSVIFLDTGSTALCLARLLKNQSGYTIITNSIPVVNELIESDNHVMITGGSIHPEVMCTTGVQTMEFLSRIKVEIAFLGSSGFDRHKGPTSNHFDDSQIKKIVIENAQTNIVLADSSKSLCSALTQYAGWRDIDYLITDSGISGETVQKLNEMTSVIVV